MNKKAIPMIIAVVLIIVIVVVGMTTGMFSKYGGSSKEADQYELMGLKEKNDTDCAIIIGNTLSEQQAVVEDGEYYLPLDVVKELNKRFFWDEEQVLLYSTPEDVIEVIPGEKSYSVSGDKQDTDYNIININDDVKYVNIKFIANYTNIEYETYEKPNRIVIRNEWDVEVSYAYASEEAVVRTESDKEADIAKKCETGEELVVLEEGGEWTKVMTKDGFTGHISTESLENHTTKTVSREWEEPVYTSIKRNEKINLVWHQVTNEYANDTLYDMVASVKGVNVISPTWFTLANEKGDINSIATGDYVNSAHDMGMEVWALIDDFARDEDDNLYIRQLLPYKSSRDKLIQNIMNELDIYGIDGINIDFEYINENTGESYIQFLRELSIECRKAGKVLSVDNYAISTWHAHYDKKEQGVVCDYIIIMGYDEHTNDSEEVGSVASLPFVRAGIEETIAEVGDSSKVINALPFYTRVWIHESDGSFTSQAVGMDTAEESLALAGATPNWSEDHGQYYAEYTSASGESCEVWLEEEESIAKKLDLMNEYNLAGAAYWKLGFEKDSVWTVIEEYFK